VGTTPLCADVPCGAWADASDPDDDRQRLPQDGVTSSGRTGNSDASAVGDPMAMDSTVEGHQVDGAVASDTLSAEPALMASVMLAVAACTLSMPPPAPMDDQPPSGHNGVIADQPPTAVPVDDDKSTRDPGADQPAPVDHAVSADGVADATAPSTWWPSTVESIVVGSPTALASELPVRPDEVTPS
jgi:hypothetical protein